MKNILSAMLLLLVSTTAFGQKGSKAHRLLGDPIVTDSNSSLMIPTRYNSELLSSNKLALWNNYYANIIFYDFTTDSSNMLFPEDTFIKAFTWERSLHNHYNNNANKLQDSSEKWIFYFVVNTDVNRNGRIDNEDPSILYVSDKQGNGLKPLTLPTENAVSISIFEKQGFALLKMQRDQNGDSNFNAKDKDLYYVRLNLDSLSLGNKIELSEANHP